MSGDSVTFNGIEFKFIDFEGDGYKDPVEVNGVEYQRWAAFHIAALADRAVNLVAVSTSTITPSLAQKTFVLTEDVTYSPGQFLQISDSVRPTDWIYCRVVSYNASQKTLVVQVLDYYQVSAGSSSSWTISLASPRASYGYFNDTLASLTNADFIITNYAPFGGEIDRAEIKNDSGTATIQFKINGVNMGSTMAASSTVAGQNLTTANTFAKGDKLTFTVTSNSTSVNFSYWLRFRDES